jgi:hypothetical protein
LGKKIIQKKSGCFHAAVQTPETRKNPHKKTILRPQRSFFLRDFFAGFGGSVVCKRFQDSSPVGAGVSGVAAFSRFGHNLSDIAPAW